jgi:hypothetical protein
MNAYDPFRPHEERARAIYDAFRAEANKRNGRRLSVWLIAERTAVWSAARDYARQRGLSVPTIGQVERAERLAVGHADYGVKWAIGVAELLVPVTSAAAAKACKP